MTRNHSTEKRRWLLLGLATLAAAFPSLTNTKTIYATDDNTVSISVDQSAELKPVGNLHKATTNVTVKTGKPYGFNLTLRATGSPDLVNQKDGNHRIKSLPVSNDSASLAANQWGYNNRNSNMYFYGVPDGSSPAVIADVTKAKPAGCTNPANCTKSVTFAANVDPAKLASGSYSTAIMYTATAKPKPTPIVEPTICKSGDPKSDCQVDLDPNMIPVKYTGSTTNAQWTSLSSPEDSSNQGNWYNYNNKQWANAVTVKDPSKYKGKDMVVDQADILGFWVYIPRYAYEVMRRDGTDKPVPAQNFLISFEKTTTPKRRPAACPERGKDYREDCDLNRDYIKGQPGNQGTWATHPAFTFGTKELNGIWFGKFETTGTRSQPTVLPNETHIFTGYNYNNKDNDKVSTFYSLATTVGINDPNNVNIDSSKPVAANNNHHLKAFSSRMVNNNDWGAAVYLSASKYGAGYNGVQINSNSELRQRGDNSYYGTTGCGPYDRGDNTPYFYRGEQYLIDLHKYKSVDFGNIGTQQACSGDGIRAYNGTIGRLASTTNNPTGVYDMSGGGWEYVAAAYDVSHKNNIDDYRSYDTNFISKASSPYSNIYNFNNTNGCTFATCGGQALYETNDGRGDGLHQWNSSYMGFVTDITTKYFGDDKKYSNGYPIFGRGGYSTGGSEAGIFYADANYGIGTDFAFRVALAPVL